MMKVKIFNSIVSTDELENKIADWGNDLDPTIHEVKLNALQLQDYYGADHQFTPGGICNQWTEYTAVVVYELKTEERSKLLHYKDTTVGLYATDRPDLIEDPKSILFQLEY